MSHQDPFNLARETVGQAVDETLAQLAAVKSIARSSSEAGSTSGGGGGGSSMLAGARLELRSMVESAVWQVDELSRAVDVSEKDPSRFRLDAKEVRKRREWVENAKQKLIKVKRELDTDAPASGARRGAPTGTFALDDDYDGGGAVDYDAEEANQQLLMKEQDDELEDISTSLQRIGQYGLQIGEELQNQEYMLNELDEDMNTTQARLNAVQKKMAQVFKKARSNSQLCMIVFLTILLMVLISLVFS